MWVRLSFSLDVLSLIRSITQNATIPYYHKLLTNYCVRLHKSIYIHIQIRSVWQFWRKWVSARVRNQCNKRKYNSKLKSMTQATNKRRYTPKKCQQTISDATHRNYRSIRKKWRYWIVVQHGTALAFTINRLYIYIYIEWLHVFIWLNTFSTTVRLITNFTRGPDRKKPRALWQYNQDDANTEHTVNTSHKLSPIL